MRIACTWLIATVALLVGVLAVPASAVILVSVIDKSQTYSQAAPLNDVLQLSCVNSTVNFVGMTFNRGVYLTQIERCHVLFQSCSVPTTGIHSFAQFPTWNSTIRLISTNIQSTLGVRLNAPMTGTNVVISGCSVSGVLQIAEFVLGYPSLDTGNAPQLVILGSSFPGLVGNGPPVAPYTIAANIVRPAGSRPGAAELLVLLANNIILPLRHIDAHTGNVVAPVGGGIWINGTADSVVLSAIVNCTSGEMAGSTLPSFEAPCVHYALDVGAITQWQMVVQYDVSFRNRTTDTSINATALVLDGTAIAFPTSGTTSVTLQYANDCDLHTPTSRCDRAHQDSATAVRISGRASHGAINVAAVSAVSDVPWLLSSVIGVDMEEKHSGMPVVWRVAGALNVHGNAAWRVAGLRGGRRLTDHLQLFSYEFEASGVHTAALVTLLGPFASVSVLASRAHASFAASRVDTPSPDSPAWLIDMPAGTTDTFVSDAAITIVHQYSGQSARGCARVRLGASAAPPRVAFVRSTCTVGMTTTTTGGGSTEPGGTAVALMIDGADGYGEATLVGFVNVSVTVSLHSSASSFAAISVAPQLRSLLQVERVAIRVAVTGGPRSSPDALVVNGLRLSGLRAAGVNSVNRFEVSVHVDDATSVSAHAIAADGHQSPTLVIARSSFVFEDAVAVLPRLSTVLVAFVMLSRPTSVALDSVNTSVLTGRPMDHVALIFACWDEAVAPVFLHVESGSITAIASAFDTTRRGSIVSGVAIRGAVAMTDALARSIEVRTSSYASSAIVFVDGGSANQIEVRNATLTATHAENITGSAIMNVNVTVLLVDGLNVTGGDRAAAIHGLHAQRSTVDNLQAFHVTVTVNGPAASSPISAVALEAVSSTNVLATALFASAASQKRTLFSGTDMAANLVLLDSLASEGGAQTGYPLLVIDGVIDRLRLQRVTGNHTIQNEGDRHAVVNVTLRCRAAAECSVGLSDTALYLQQPRALSDMPITTCAIVAPDHNVSLSHSGFEATRTGDRTSGSGKVTALDVDALQVTMSNCGVSTKCAGAPCDAVGAKIIGKHTVLVTASLTNASSSSTELSTAESSAVGLEVAGLSVAVAQTTSVASLEGEAVCPQLGAVTRPLGGTVVALAARSTEHDETPTLASQLVLHQSHFSIRVVGSGPAPQSFFPVRCDVGSVPGFAPTVSAAAVDNFTSVILSGATAQAFMDGAASMAQGSAQTLTPMTAVSILSTLSVVNVTGEAVIATVQASAGSPVFSDVTAILVKAPHTDILAHGITTIVFGDAAVHRNCTGISVAGHSQQLSAIGPVHASVQCRPPPQGNPGGSTAISVRETLPLRDLLTVSQNVSSLNLGNAFTATVEDSRAAAAITAAFVSEHNLSLTMHAVQIRLQAGGDSSVIRVASTTPAAFSVTLARPTLNLAADDGASLVDMRRAATCAVLTVAVTDSVASFSGSGANLLLRLPSNVGDLGITITNATVASNASAARVTLADPQQTVRRCEGHNETASSVFVHCLTMHGAAYSRADLLREAGGMMFPSSPFWGAAVVPCASMTDTEHYVTPSESLSQQPTDTSRPSESLTVSESDSALESATLRTPTESRTGSGNSQTRTRSKETPSATLSHSVPFASLSWGGVEELVLSFDAVMRPRGALMLPVAVGGDDRFIDGVRCFASLRTTATAADGQLRRYFDAGRGSLLGNGTEGSLQFAWSSLTQPSFSPMMAAIAERPEVLMPAAVTVTVHLATTHCMTHQPPAADPVLAFRVAPPPTPLAAPVLSSGTTTGLAIVTAAFAAVTSPASGALFAQAALIGTLPACHNDGEGGAALASSVALNPLQIVPSGTTSRVSGLVAGNAAIGAAAVVLAFLAAAAKVTMFATPDVSTMPRGLLWARLPSAIAVPVAWLGPAVVANSVVGMLESTGGARAPFVIFFIVSLAVTLGPACVLRRLPQVQYEAHTDGWLQRRCPSESGWRQCFTYLRPSGHWASEDLLWAHALRLQVAGNAGVPGSHLPTVPVPFEVLGCLIVAMAVGLALASAGLCNLCAWICALATVLVAVALLVRRPYTTLAANALGAASAGASTIAAGALALYVDTDPKQEAPDTTLRGIAAAAVATSVALTLGRSVVDAFVAVMEEVGCDEGVDDASSAAAEEEDIELPEVPEKAEPLLANVPTSCAVPMPLERSTATTVPPERGAAMIDFDDAANPSRSPSPRRPGGPSPAARGVLEQHLAARDATSRSRSRVETALAEALAARSRIARTEHELNRLVRSDQEGGRPSRGRRSGPPRDHENNHADL